MDSTDPTQPMTGQSPVHVPGAMMTEYQGHPSANKKIGIIVGIIVIVAIIAGVGIWAWLTYGKSMTPEQVLEKMMIASQSVTASAVDANVIAEITDPALSPNPILITLAMNGAKEKMSPASFKGNNMITISADTPEGELSGSVEVRVVDNTAYLRLTKISSLVESTIGSGRINQWGSITGDEFKTYLQESKNNPEQIQADTYNMDEIFALLTGTQTMTDQTQQQALELYKQYPLFGVKNVLTNEVVNDQAMHHYELELNKANVYPFLKDYSALVAPDTFAGKTEADMLQMEKEINDTTHAIPLTMEVWIGKKDYYLHRAIVGASIDTSTDVGKQVLQMDQGSAKFTAMVNFKDYNKAVDVVKPDSAQSLVSMFNSFMTPPEPVEPAPMVIDTTIDTDGDGLPDFMETSFYYTDPFNPDTDGDGYVDGEEVDNGYNPNGPGLLKDALPPVAPDTVK